ncbi:hypothetical protein WJX84_006385 [Apatococcus fuscideae]|uniref:Uncharacterized protein n=1 Tax=Apatococcus fuscideae TaxID=2026836 RepID=A0AAW1TCH4_9CHLO
MDNLPNEMHLADAWLGAASGHWSNRLLSDVEWSQQQAESSKALHALLVQPAQLRWPKSGECDDADLHCLHLCQLHCGIGSQDGRLGRAAEVCCGRADLATQRWEAATMHSQELSRCTLSNLRSISKEGHIKNPG